jgi:RimJ/RimL family protein N-acetyltransferase
VEDRIKVERTDDYELIRRLAIHPAIFPHISDDFTDKADQWKPIESDFVRYLIAQDSEGVIGFSVFMPTTWAHWTAHVAFLPRSYGPKAISAFREMLAWMWKHTSACRITGEICQENRRAIQFAVRAGFKQYGVNGKSRLRGGVLRDQVCLGISKPE